MAPGLTGSARLEALVDRVKRRQKELSSLEADFVQVRASEFLTTPETSRGTFSYRAPDLVRWEYLEPRPVSLVIRDDEMTTWYRDLGRAERLKVGKVSGQIFKYLNATGSLESLLKYFSVSFSLPHGDEPFRLELDPLYARIGKRVSHLSISIDRGLDLPTAVRFEEPNGDSTEYRFENLKPNVTIADDRFDLVLPEGVVVTEVDLERGAPR